MQLFLERESQNRNTSKDGGFEAKTSGNARQMGTFLFFAFGVGYFGGASVSVCFV
jgi:hypothetical protein